MSLLHHNDSTKSKTQHHNLMVCRLIIIQYGGFLKCGYPQIVHFNRIFHYQPSILGYPHFMGTVNLPRPLNFTEGANNCLLTKLSRAVKKVFLVCSDHVSTKVCPDQTHLPPPSMHFAVAPGPVFFILSGGWHEVVPDQVRRHPLELMASGEIEWRERSLARKSRGGSC